MRSRSCTKTARWLDHCPALMPELVYDLLHPNAEFTERHNQPLLERNPVGFWRGVALLSLLVNLVLLYLLHRG